MALSIDWQIRTKRLGTPSSSADARPVWQRKRWWSASIALLLLVLYAGAVAWSAHRLEEDIQKSIHVLSGPVPDQQ